MQHNMLHQDVMLYTITWYVRNKHIIKVTYNTSTVCCSLYLGGVVSTPSIGGHQRGAPSKKTHKICDLASRKTRTVKSFRRSMFHRGMLYVHALLFQSRRGRSWTARRKLQLSASALLLLLLLLLLYIYIYM